MDKGNLGNELISTFQENWGNRKMVSNGPELSVINLRVWSKNHLHENHVEKKKLGALRPSLGLLTQKSLAGAWASAFLTRPPDSLMHNTPTLRTNLTQDSELWHTHTINPTPNYNRQLPSCSLAAWGSEGEPKTMHITVWKCHLLNKKILHAGVPQDSPALLVRREWVQPFQALETFLFSNWVIVLLRIYPEENETKTRLYIQTSLAETQTKPEKS